MKVSVVLANYNKGLYLKKCLDSLLCQDFSDYEIIVVDDGSNDNSIEILKEYEKEPKIKLFFEENKGASKARNKGILEATGEYLLILDTDDFFEPSLLSEAYGAVSKNNSDICIFDFIIYNSKTSRTMPSKYLFREKFIPDKEVFSRKDADFIFQISQNYAWNKIFKREFILNKNIFFQNSKYLNDTYFTMIALALADKITVCKKKLVYYRINEDESITSSDVREKYPLEVYNVLSEIKQRLVLENIFSEVEKSFINEASEHFNYNLSKLKGKPFFSLYSKIKNQYLKEFNMQNKGYDYFIDKKRKKTIDKIESGKYLLERFLQNVFSIKNNYSNKIMTVFGIKFNLKKRYKIKYINKNALNRKIKKFNAKGISGKDKPELVVSLTSYPKRMHDIHFCLYSLLNQTLKPDRIVLYLSNEEFLNKEKDLPEEVLNFLKNGLEIRWCKNLKSYKKLIPALVDFKDSCIVTADDDIYYPKDWLQKLYDAHLKDKENIQCQRARIIGIDKNENILPYSKWRFVTKENRENKGQAFFTGAGGVLYPKNSLYTDVLREDIFMKLAPFGDDIWFFAMALLGGRKIKVVEDGYSNLIYVNPERELGLNNEETLFAINGENNNDRQLNRVLEHYKNLKEIILSCK